MMTLCIDIPTRTIFILSSDMELFGFRSLSEKYLKHLKHLFVQQNNVHARERDMRLCSFIYCRCDASRQGKGIEIFIIYELVMFFKFHHLLTALNTYTYSRHWNQGRAAWSSPHTLYSLMINGDTSWVESGV